MKSKTMTAASHIASIIRADVQNRGTDAITVAHEVASEMAHTDPTSFVATCDDKTFDRIVKRAAREAKQ